MVGPQQTAEELLAFHPPDRTDTACVLSLACSHAARNAIADALMRALLVEMPAVESHDAAQALDAEQDQVVQTFLAQASAPSLDDRIVRLLRCMTTSTNARRRPQNVHISFVNKSAHRSTSACRARNSRQVKPLRSGDGGKLLRRRMSAMQLFDSLMPSFLNSPQSKALLRHQISFESGLEHRWRGDYHSPSQYARLQNAYEYSDPASAGKLLTWASLRR